MRAVSMSAARLRELLGAHELPELFAASPKARARTRSSPRHDVAALRAAREILYTRRQGALSPALARGQEPRADRRDDDELVEAQGAAACSSPRTTSSASSACAAAFVEQLDAELTLAQLARAGRVPTDAAEGAFERGTEPRSSRTCAAPEWEERAPAARAAGQRHNEVAQRVGYEPEQVRAAFREFGLPPSAL